MLAEDVRVTFAVADALAATEAVADASTMISPPSADAEDAAVATIVDSSDGALYKPTPYAERPYVAELLSTYGFSEYSESLY